MEILPNEFREILSRHEQWLHTGGLSGERANLNDRAFVGADGGVFDLRGVDLSKVYLRNARFEHADLSFARLWEAQLVGAQFGEGVILESVDFRKCELNDVNFGQADVRNAMFHGACLDDANLESAQRLLPKQLFGTNLTRTRLAEGYKFSGIEQVNKLTALGRQSFFLMLAVSVFILFSIATTHDAELIAGRSAKALPVVNIDLPIAGFVVVAPVIVLALYLYLTLYLVSLFEEISTLPAVFPDGRGLDQHVEPWLMTSLVYRYDLILNKRRPGLSSLRG